MTEERTDTRPVPIVQHAVMPRSACAAFVPKRSVPDTLGNGVGEIERDTATPRQHVRISGPAECLAELDGDVPPCIVQVCQEGIRPLAGLCCGFCRRLVDRRAIRGPSAGLGESAHRMRVFGCGDFHLHPDQASIRTMAPDVGGGLIAVSGNVHGPSRRNVSGNEVWLRASSLGAGMSPNAGRDAITPFASGPDLVSGPTDLKRNRTATRPRF